MRRNNRNTLLLISGITQIIKSFAYCIAMLLTSICFDVIDLTIRRKIYLTTTYAIKPELGEKIITLITIGIFVYLALAIIINFASGMIFFLESKRGKNELKNRNLVVVMAIISIFTLNGFVPNILSLIALLIDKKQPNSEMKETINDHNLKVKVNEILTLKNEKSITYKEYIELLTKVLTE